MKKIIAVILIIIVMTGAFVLSYQYRNQKILQQGVNMSDDFDGRLPSKKSSANSRLLVEDKENDYQLYFNGEAVTVLHGEYKIDILTWTSAVNTQTPTIYCKDYDGDGQKELLVRIVSGVTTTVSGVDEYSYTLNLIKPITTTTGEKSFSIISATSDTWKNIFENSIKCELTQLKSCKKFLQFVMDDAKEKVVYDSQTGITTNPHVTYALAQADNKQQYYTLNRWNKGLGVYKVDDNGDITLDIQVIVKYDEFSGEHYVGNIHCGMALYNDKFNIIPNTIVFVPNDNYVSTDPRDTAKNNWKCRITNEGVNNNFKNTDIDWIEAQFSLSALADENVQNFESLMSKIKCIDRVEFTQQSVVLTAKKNYTFSQRIADKGTYSVIINKGESGEYNIAYTCEIKNDGGLSVLTINFDKTYDKEDFDKILIKFGV